MQAIRNYAYAHHHPSYQAINRVDTWQPSHLFLIRHMAAILQMVCLTHQLSEPTADAILHATTLDILQIQLKHLSMRHVEEYDQRLPALQNLHAITKFLNLSLHDNSIKYLAVCAHKLFLFFLTAQIVYRAIQYLLRHL